MHTYFCCLDELEGVLGVHPFCIIVVVVVVVVHFTQSCFDELEGVWRLHLATARHRF